MSKNPQTYFTTGEFAKLCGVNKRTLFHYDDIGLFQPAITNDKEYRYYSHHQFDVFNIISILKELKVPLKEIKLYLDERTPERILELSKQKIAEVAREIEKLNHIKHILEETIVFTNQRLRADLEKIIVEEQEEMSIILSTLLNEENMKEDYIKWMLAFRSFENRTQSKETSFVGAMISRENILNSNYSNQSYFFVKTSSNRQPNLSIAIKPKGLYAVAYHPGSYETIGRTYEKLIAFSEKNHLRMLEFAYEEYLIDEVAVKNETEYITRITVGVSPSE
ncbi:DNA-binding transcriptional regulator, MerR family [Fontibacillus panacisegetis]|uniref:DNA-binding transcriptional regulator, MerR family n=1 Tax=Fontibacillus panacisegetis TaxID=670482 RepID=A0A1G7IVT0_9BACL|nr:MerR family transcriptional regulator [Fontibacillus panacisegetis]SDF16718.1 DNA-binding transcriptional regulator, MerR family [Fontibacillus panacisegetis]